jgi:hypothetical protein
MGSEPPTSDADVYRQPRHQTHVNDDLNASTASIPADSASDAASIARHRSRRPASSRPHNHNHNPYPHTSSTSTSSSPSALAEAVLPHLRPALASLASSLHTALAARTAELNDQHRALAAKQDQGQRDLLEYLDEAVRGLAESARARDELVKRQLGVAERRAAKGAEEGVGAVRRDYQRYVCYSEIQYMHR